LDLELERVRARYTEVTGTNHSQEFSRTFFEAESRTILDLFRQHTNQGGEPSDPSGDTSSDS
jgi:hypothetical protein